MSLSTTGAAGATTMTSVASRRFDQFVRGEREALVRFLRTRVPNREDAEDAAQESLTRLMHYRDAQPEAAWKALLYRIAGNVAIDQARHARTRRANQHESFDETVHDFACEASSHAERLDGQQELMLLRNAILKLPPRCQQVYLLNRIDGMSYRQIARHLGVTVKAIEKHLSKALTILRAELASRRRGAFPE